MNENLQDVLDYLNSGKDLMLKLQNMSLDTTPQTKPIVIIVDPGSLPAGLFMRTSVLDAVRKEIEADYINTGELPQGAILNEEVEESGKTKEISNQNDSSNRPTNSGRSKTGRQNNEAGAGGNSKNITGANNRKKKNRKATK